MSDSIELSSTQNSNSSLYEILKSCANLQSYDSLPVADYNDVCLPTVLHENYKMLTTNSTVSSFASEESFSDSQNILEEDGRISLAYENLRTIPRRIAEKFAAQTKLLDLSYNNFQNLSFLMFFEELHTLILDRNNRLDANTLPHLPNLKILWINNCDILNLTDWIHRIRTQCPLLEHLSIMGNPGIKNLCIKNTSVMESILESPIIDSESTDYRYYILQVLPNLEYIDGTPRRAIYAQLSLSTTACKGKSVEQDTTPDTGNSASDHKLIINSPSLCLKDLFRLKRRKKSYQNSSTN